MGGNRFTKSFTRIDQGITDVNVVFSSVPTDTYLGRINIFFISIRLRFD